MHVSRDQVFLNAVQFLFCAKSDNGPEYQRRPSKDKTKHNKLKLMPNKDKA